MCTFKISPFLPTPCESVTTYIHCVNVMEYLSLWAYTINQRDRLFLQFSLPLDCFIDCLIVLILRYNSFPASCSVTYSHGTVTKVLQNIVVNSGEMVKHGESAELQCDRGYYPDNRVYKCQFGNFSSTTHGPFQDCKYGIFSWSIFMFLTFVLTSYELDLLHGFIFYLWQWLRLVLIIVSFTYLILMCSIDSDLVCTRAIRVIQFRCDKVYMDSF